MKKPLALREWRYPRTYRTIFAKEPGSIFQADVMHLKPLWKNIFNEEEIQTLRLKNYVLVCIDVFSRYVWAVAMDSQDAPSTASAMIKIFVHMERPKILQGDKKITDYFKKEFSVYFPDVTLVTSKPSETNKNAIVERVIRTIKNDLLKFLYTHELPKQPLDYDITTTILQYVCSLRNNIFHRTIQQKPFDVFYGRAANRQIIERKTYPQFKVDNPVLIKPLRERGDIAIKPFRFDYDTMLLLKRMGTSIK
jgi:transposase InsO family protein